MGVPELPVASKPDGDTWTTILSFLGIGVVKQVSENQTNNSTMASDAELRRTFLANAVYEVRGGIIHNSNSTADFKFQFVETSAGGVTAEFDVLGIASGGTTYTIQSGGLGTVFTGEGASANKAMTFQGWLNAGANGGDLVVQWAQNTLNASTTSMVAGSWLSLRRLS